MQPTLSRDRGCRRSRTARLRYTEVMTADRGASDADPVIEAYKRDADRTLLRQNLKLNVEERLRQLMELQKFAEE